METREELFEELKRDMVKTVQYREGMPNDIRRIVKQTFSNLEVIFNELECNNSTIQTFKDAELNEVEIKLNRIGERRINSQLDELRNVLYQVQKDIEEYDGDELKSKVAKHMDYLSQIGKNDSKSINDILDKLQDSLIAIKNRQCVNLENRGFSQRQIECVTDQLKSLTIKVQGKYEEIAAIFAEDAKSMQKKLQEQYNLFLVQINRNEKDSFRESLQSGISLEEQRKNAEEFANKQKEKDEQPTIGKSLPGNVIE